MKKPFAIRKSLRNASSKFSSPLQEIHEETLSQLGVHQSTRSAWQKIPDSISNLILKFEMSHLKTATQEWLNIIEVQYALQELSEARIANRPESLKQREKLVEMLATISSDHPKRCEGIVDIFINALAAGVTAPIKDSAMAAHSQIHFQQLHKRFDALQAITEHPAIVKESLNPISSYDIEAIAAKDAPISNVHLAIAKRIDSGDYQTSIVGTIFLTTDQPKKLVDAITSIRNSVINDPLATNDAKQFALTASLKKLITDSRTQAIALPKLATVYFSAYFYYCNRSDFENSSTNIQVEKLMVNPLIHRLSNKKENITRFQTAIEDLPIHLQSALSTIESTFHRHLALPSQGTSKFDPIEELASLVLDFACEYLADRKNITVNTIFASLRTRIRYAENVFSGEKHTRDNNPLPY